MKRLALAALLGWLIKKLWNYINPLDAPRYEMRRTDRER